MEMKRAQDDRGGDAAPRAPAMALSAWVALLALGVFLAACSSLPSPGEELVGMAYSLDGSPVAGATVSVCGAEALTDAEGRFSLPWPFPPGKPRPCPVAASRPGYEEYRGEVILSSRKDALYLSLRSAGDLRSLSLDALRSGDWVLAISLARRALAAGGEAESSFLLALLLSAPANPRPVPREAAALVEGLISQGREDAALLRLRSELSPQGSPLPGERSALP